MLAAVGWVFAGVATPQESPAGDVLRTIMGDVLDVAPEDVDPTSLGLGGLGLFMIMSLAEYANRMQAGGLEVTGASLFDYPGTTDGLTLRPGVGEIDCEFSPIYPAICSFVFPFAEYQAGGEVVTIPGSRSGVERSRPALTGRRVRGRGRPCSSLRRWRGTRRSTTCHRCPGPLGPCRSRLLRAWTRASRPGACTSSSRGRAH